MIDPPEAVTEDVRYQTVHDARERDATRARKAQALYLRLTRVFIVATALAAVAGGLVLYGLEASEEAPRRLVRWLANDAVQYSLIAFQALCLGTAGFCGYMLGEHDPRARWIGSRLRAEEGRLVLARRVLEIGHELGQEIFEKSGEWFVAFVDNQLQHLRESADKRENAAFSLLVLGGLLAGMMALSAALAGINLGVVVVALAILGVIAPALTSAVRSWREATAHKRRAALHDRSWTRLNELKGEVPKFEEAVGESNLEGALEFAEKVFDVLRHDHAGFASIYDDDDDKAPDAGSGE